MNFQDWHKITIQKDYNQIFILDGHKIQVEKALYILKDRKLIWMKVISLYNPSSFYVTQKTKVPEIILLSINLRQTLNAKILFMRIHLHMRDSWLRL